MAKFQATYIENIKEEPASTIGHVNDFKTQQDLKLTHNYTADELPPSKIVKFIKGYQWTVDYYNNNGDVNTKSTPLGTDISTHVQNYIKIKNCVIYLESPLDVTSVSDLGFKCIINAGFIPIKYDIIISEMIGGKKAMFECIDVKQEHYQTHTVYSTEFKFKFFLNNTSEAYFNILENKTTKTLVYDKNYILDNGSPLLLQDDYDNKIKLKKIRNELMSFYFNKFIDVETKYLSINARKGNNIGYLNKELPIIDNYLFNFIRSTIDSSENYLYSTIAFISYVTNYDLTIFDVILKKDIDLLDDTVNEITYNVPLNSGPMPEVRSIYYSDVGLIATPKYSYPDDRYVCRLNKEYFLTESTSPMKDKNIKDYYIFSEAFYKRDLTNMNVIEQFIYKFITNENIDQSNVTSYLEKYRHWSTYDQFYIIPILIYILRTLTQNTYSEL